MLIYRAGFTGIDDTGSLKLVMRYATDSGTPQFDDPYAANYVTATASNGAYLQLRYDVKDNIRPWGKTILVKVLQGYLREGDTITVALGDRSSGSPGWRMQTFVEHRFQIRVLVDRYATYDYEPLPKCPLFRIVPGEPIKLVAIAPTLVVPGRKIVVRWKLEDKWGNPVGKAKRFIHPGFEQPGCYTITIADDVSGLTAESNPIVVRGGEIFGRFWADLHGQSEETIGTNSVAEYFRFARNYGFIDICSHQGNDFQITDEFWQTIQETTKQFYRSGKFVTFPGWEWSGNTGLGGDRNVVFREEGGRISRSSRALVPLVKSADPCSETVEDLFNRFDRSKPPVMLIPHVGGRYADLSRHREGLEPAVEVHSAWGTFEWMLDDAFRNGYRVAIVANSDGHKGRPGASYPGASKFGSYGGLTCVLAEHLDRESIWQAYQQRRVYATTGARIFLDVTAESDTAMGSVLRLTGRSEMPHFDVRVHGTASIERVEFRNAMRVLKTFRPDSDADARSRVKILWQGAAVRGRGRQVTWDGRLKVSRNRIRNFEPINFYNAEQTCSQTSPTTLQWNSTTTGGVAGVIVDLEKANSGELKVTTAQNSFHVRVKDLGVRGRRYRLAGIGKMISVYRVPPAGNRRTIAFRYRPSRRQLKRGDNPIYACVVQEDGHMAWSSPIYLLKS